MPRTKTYQVKDNRIRYICSNCKTKRSLSVPPQVRSRSIKCHNCGEQTRCNLNRRSLTRESQSGRVTMCLSSGHEMDVDLHDISLAGVGAAVQPGGCRSLSVRDEVKFKCSWNPSLLTRGRYVITSINGNRIGIQNIAYKSF